MAKSPVALFYFIDRNRPPADQGDGAGHPTRRAQLPGLPRDEPEPQWYDILLEDRQAAQGIQAETAKREAEEELKRQPSAARLHAAITGSTDRSSMALNSAGILRAALGGGSGTINGRPA